MICVAPEPAGTEVGVRPPAVLIVGMLPMVNVTAFEVVPPGFVTLTSAVPGEARSTPGTLVVNWLALTKTVVSVWVCVPAH